VIIDYKASKSANTHANTQLATIMSKYTIDYNPIFMILF